MLKLVAFDFDGTLADSVDFCLAVYLSVFQKFMGENAPDREQIYQTFGMNEPGVIRHFLGDASPEAEQEFYRLHRQLHAEMCPEPYPGILPFLDFLKEKGILLTILTGRAETTCQISMECLNMGHYFSRYQYGSPVKNDKCAQLLKLMEETGLTRDEIVYVGDAVSDAEACKAANVTCLSAAWAKTARIGELERINPGLIFRSVEEMQNYISEHLL